MLFIIHYHEIGLKGKNRPLFERRLAANIRATVPKTRATRIAFKRIIVDVDDATSRENAITALQYVFGIEYFAPAHACAADMAAIIPASIAALPNNFSGTFRISARRADKRFPHSSQEMNALIGAAIQEHYPQAVVDLDNPERTVFMEILPDEVLVYAEKIRGAGGLPALTSGTVVSLLSSGIDSPVSSWQLAKRGAQLVLVHFHSYPQTSRLSIENVKAITQALLPYCLSLKLYLVPLLPLQKEALLKTNRSLMLILYRRSMLRIAERIATREYAAALATGESLGQVASQTLENLSVIGQSVTIPLLRPNIGMDKEEIIVRAQKIGTFELSIKPYEDCCSLFVPHHPETKAKLSAVLAEEAKLDLASLEEDAYANAEVLSYAYQPNVE